MPKPTSGLSSACETESKLSTPSVWSHGWAKAPAALLLVLVLGLLNGCQRSDNNAAATDAPATLSSDSATAGSGSADAANLATTHVWQQLNERSQACLLAAQTLQQSSEQLLAQPTTGSLTQTRHDWLISHDCVQDLSPLLTLSRASSGLFGALRSLRYSIDAWPLQPGYLDYFDIYPHSGLVNDISVSLTPRNLRKQHGLTDSEDVSIGLHAMAYLLWGEHGERPLTDFVAIDTETEATATPDVALADLPANRRRQLLQIQAQLLTEDLQALQQLTAINQPMYLAYMGLPTESRLHLWKQVTAHQLHHPLLLSLADATATDSMPPHTSHGAGELAHRLASLERLLFGENTGLARQWLQTDQISQLNAQMEGLQQRLRQTPVDPAALRQQLGQLHALLAALKITAPGLTDIELSPEPVAATDTPPA